MDRSPNGYVNSILRIIGEKTLESIKNYLDEILTRDYVDFRTGEQIKDFFASFIESYYKNTSYQDREKIRFYTGLDYNRINSVFKGIWNYEHNGALTPDKEKEYRKEGNIISGLITNNAFLQDNIKAYRGVNIDQFYTYGCSELSDLLNLKGGWFYERGFTSTSLVREKSFFYKPVPGRENTNIEIEFLIPKEFEEGIPLMCEDTTLYPEETEFLIDNGTLFKILDVIVDLENNKAYIKMASVPRKVYDLPYDNNKSLN